MYSTAYHDSHVGSTAQKYMRVFSAHGLPATRCSRQSEEYDRKYLWCAPEPRARKQDQGARRVGRERLPQRRWPPPGGGGPAIDLAEYDQFHCSPSRPSSVDWQYHFSPGKERYARWLPSETELRVPPSEVATSPSKPRTELQAIAWKRQALGRLAQARSNPHVHARVCADVRTRVYTGTHRKAG